MVNDMRFTGNGDRRGHRQHRGKGASKVDYCFQSGRVGLMVLNPAS